jgi:hypothetical protein
MAENRFKKSITNATENTVYNIKDNAGDNIKDSIVDNQLANALHEASDTSDVLKKVLENSKKSRGSNHTIYLSADVGDALVKYAKKYKKNKSTLVDEILREVLIK